MRFPVFCLNGQSRIHVGLGLCRGIAQLLACEFGTFIGFGFVPFDDLRNPALAVSGLS